MKTYTIGQLAEQFNLPQSTLRYYEDLELLTDVGRDRGNKRVYDERHVNRLGMILCFKRTGMSIADINALVDFEGDLNNHSRDIVELLESHHLKLHHRIEEMQQDLDHIERKVRFYKAIGEALEHNQPLPEWDAFKQL